MGPAGLGLELFSFLVHTVISTTVSIQFIKDTVK